MAYRIKDEDIEKAIAELARNIESKIAAISNSPFYLTNEILKFYSEQPILHFVRKISPEGGGQKEFFVYQKL